MDIWIRGGQVVDGIGSAPAPLDVLIERGRITDIGRFEEVEVRARYVIDASGMIVSPGFIDGHTHSDLSLLHNRQHPSAAYQGISTLVTGQCGLGFAPMQPEQWQDSIRFNAGIFGDHHDQLPRWDSFDSFLNLLNGCAANVGALASHNAVRQMALGFSSDPLTGSALDKAKAALDTALDQGALGLSVGLCYYPGAYADTAELIELCRVLKAHDGLFCVHHRLPFAYSGVDPIEEIVSVVRQTGVRLNMLHYKTAGWAGPESILRPFDALVKDGFDVHFEFYPYLVGAGFLLSLFPGWAQEGGYAPMMQRLQDRKLRSALIRDLALRQPVFFPGGAMWRVVHTKDPHSLDLGKTSAEIARERGETIPEMMIRLLLENEMVVAFEGVQWQDEPLADKLYADQRELFAHPLYTMGSDAIDQGVLCHPRAWGAFPRVIRQMLDGGMPIERILPKITSLPAQIYHLKDRGVLRRGALADVCVFDPRTIKDTATFETPRTPAQGVRTLIVNGTPVLMDGALTGLLPGTALRANR